MAKTLHLLLGCIVVTTLAHAAPSENNPAPAETEDAKNRFLITNEEVAKDLPAQTQRQKRWYSGYGFQPYLPPPAAPFYERQDDSLLEIYRRLKEISAWVRQPKPDQTPQQSIPVYFPVIFVPLPGCGCEPSNESGTAPPPIPSTPATGNNDTSPDVTSRWPQMEDSNQNWGIDAVEEDDDQDYSRPISFQPVQPDRPMSRPPPPVEHGSVQGDTSAPTPPTTTFSPLPSMTPEASRAPSGAPGNSRAVSPTACDVAILTCCHQPSLTYDCFTGLGCNDLSPYSGNPCKAGVILNVVEKYRRFYGQGTG